jgi:hypothetical protein
MAKGFDSIVILVCWLLWKECNEHDFGNAFMSVAELVHWIHRVGCQWELAGFIHLSDLV